MLQRGRRTGWAADPDRWRAPGAAAARLRGGCHRGAVASHRAAPMVAGGCRGLDTAEARAPVFRLRHSPGRARNPPPPTVSQGARSLRLKPPVVPGRGIIGVRGEPRSGLRVGPLRAARSPPRVSGSDLPSTLRAHSVPPTPSVACGDRQGASPLARPQPPPGQRHASAVPRPRRTRRTPVGPSKHAACTGNGFARHLSDPVFPRTYPLSPTPLPGRAPEARRDQTRHEPTALTPAPGSAPRCR